MNNELFIISRNIDNIFNENNDIICCGIYTNLEIAKYNLKNIYKKTPDYKHYGYKIQVYELVENEYKLINKIYIYTFDKFIEI
jgi:hypothetical protein